MASSEGLLCREEDTPDQLEDGVERKVAKQFGVRDDKRQ
jgi:hypothetical protein